MFRLSKYFYLSIAFFLNLNVFSADSFVYNNFNNHGAIGLINMPTARFYKESSFGFSVYDGDPDQKITMTSFPFDWLEASFFILMFKVSLIVMSIMIQFVIKTIRIKGLILS